MPEDRERIVFTTDDGENVDFYVLEQTRINGADYLLVSDENTDEANALILKENRSDSDEIIYDVVEDETELSAIARVFEEMLEDFDIET